MEINYPTGSRIKQIAKINGELKVVPVKDSLEAKNWVRQMNDKTIELFTYMYATDGTVSAIIPQSVASQERNNNA